LFRFIAEVGPQVVIIAFPSAKEFVALQAFPAIVFVTFTRPSILRVTAFFASPFAFHGMFRVLVIGSFAAGTVLSVLENIGLLPNSIEMFVVEEKEYCHIIVVWTVSNQWFVVAKLAKYQAFENVSSMVFVVKHVDHWPKERFRIILIQVQWDSGICHQLDGIVSNISNSHAVASHVHQEFVSGEFANVMDECCLDGLEEAMFVAFVVYLQIMKLKFTF
jgi:hypothetical protein